MKTKINSSVLALIAAGNDSLLSEAVVGLYDRQTEVEQLQKATIVVNDRGLYPRDVNLLTEAALSVKVNGRLPKGKVEAVRLRVLQYRRQVSEILETKLPLEGEKH